MCHQGSLVVMKSVKKTRMGEPSFAKALAISILIISSVPLPLAFYMSGIDWIFQGISAVPKEFLATYFLELLILVISISVFKIKEKISQQK